MPAAGSACDANGNSNANANGNNNAEPRRLRVVDILRTHAADYVRRRGRAAGLHERSTLAQLIACRTPTLGGRVWRCDECGATRLEYHSCRNRFCSGCGGAKRARWLEQLASSLLPVPHFHLVFTLPHELSALVLGNRRVLYDLLFRTAWETLRDVALDPRHLGADIGAVLVLHTWGQTLEHHPHVHAVVPGGGLSLDGTRWLAARSPRFLLPVRVLSRRFRGKFLAGLSKLRAAGQLRLELSPQQQQQQPANAVPTTATLADEATWRAWFAALRAREWVVFSQAPPPEIGPNHPAPLLKYLARYVSGAAISDARLLGHTDGVVTFRAKNYRAGRKRMTLALSGVEFTRRFAMHILPKGLSRVRRYGLLAPRSEAGTRYRELLANLSPEAAEPNSQQTAEQTDDTNADSTNPRCREPLCTGTLHRDADLPRPSLSVILYRSPLSRRAVSTPPRRQTNDSS